MRAIKLKGPVSAAAIDRAMKVRNINVEALVDLLATMMADTARTMKLYGQMIPNMKSGGCHDGALSVRYQLSPVLTQAPEPMM